MEHTPTLNAAEIDKKAKEVYSRLTLFLLAYFGLLFISFALSSVLIIAGVFLIISLTGLPLGVPLVVYGGFTSYFMIRFLFVSGKKNREPRIRITENDEPQLFNVLKNLTTEIGTKMPLKVYLESGVQASVFYNSSFLSLFKDSGKNLTIGVGLINTLSDNELKSVLAHEFGHFSQKTMKTGNYVYNVNRFIYNILYTDSGQNTVFSKIDDIAIVGFSTFQRVLGAHLQAIRWIMTRSYQPSYLRYMEISRAMEFGADAIACKAVGGKPLGDALLRFDISSNSFDTVIEFYNGQIEKCRSTKNIYSNHLLMLKRNADYWGIDLIDGRPMVTIEKYSSLSSSHILFQNQWHTHPSVADRIKYFPASNHALPEDQRAWSLFQQATRWQEEMTALMFKPVKYSKSPEFIDNDRFGELFDEVTAIHTFDKMYGTYYDKIEFAVFDLKTAREGVPVKNRIDEVFSAELTQQVSELRMLNQDVEILKYLESDKKIKYFEHNGQKKDRLAIPQLMIEVEKERDDLGSKVEYVNQLSYVFFRNLANDSQKTQLDQFYTELFSSIEKVPLDIELHNALIQCVQDSTRGDLSIKGIIMRVDKLLEHEKRFKERIASFMDNKSIVSDLTEESIDLINRYLSKTLVFFRYEMYINEDYQLLMTIVNYFGYLSNQQIALQKKLLLDFQSHEIGKQLLNSSPTHHSKTQQSYEP